MKKINLAAAEMIKKICSLQEQLIIWISEAQDQQVKYYDKRHLWQTFAEDNQVWLSEIYLQTDWSSKKLDYCHLSPFTVCKKISDQAYWLDLLNIMKVHSVFHVSFLKLY